MRRRDLAPEPVADDVLDSPVRSEQVLSSSSAPAHEALIAIVKGK